MSDDNVTPIFGRQEPTDQTEASVPAGRLYDIQLKDKSEHQAFGYLALNGVFVCILDRPNDALGISFYAPAEMISYIAEADVSDED